jgi:hypothetical protein
VRLIKSAGGEALFVKTDMKKAAEIAAMLLVPSSASANLTMR